MRKVVDEVVYPDAQACEESGKCVSPLLSFFSSCSQLCRLVLLLTVAFSSASARYPSDKVNEVLAEHNVHAMRFGVRPFSILR